jgi:hypothetical protein
MTQVGRSIVFSLILVFAVDAAARAQGEARDRQGQEQPPAAKPPKRPAPPLFGKHRRGLYTNDQGIEVVDATPQSPPLETDDPGVPDKGEYEINLTTHFDLADDVQRLDLLFVDANYGILPKIAGHELPTQVKFEFPVAAARENGNPFTFGVGAAKFGLKFNFYNDLHEGVSVAFYPQIEFAAPGSGGVEKGLAEPGQTVILPLLVSKELRYFSLVVNGAVNAPLHDPERTTTGTFGVGVGRAFRRRFAAMMEVRSESTFDFKRDRLVVMNGGVIYGVNNKVVYAKLGSSLFSDDGLTHVYVGVGLKVLIQPKQTTTPFLISHR